jgi:hypothetical protein
LLLAQLKRSVISIKRALPGAESARGRAEREREREREREDSLAV